MPSTPPDLDPELRVWSVLGYIVDPKCKQEHDRCTRPDRQNDVRIAQIVNFVTPNESDQGGCLPGEIRTAWDLFHRPVEILIGGL